MLPGRGRHIVLLDALSAIPTGPSQASVLDGLRRVILDGVAVPGSPIPVGEVAGVFGVSPIPVREALKTLVGEGLVGHETNGGYFVAQLTGDELREIYYVRGVLERAALGRAIERATADDLDAARAANDALLEATMTADLRAYQVNSRRFHQALIAPCGMHRLINMFESTWNITEPFQLMRTATPQMQTRLHADHQAMMTAMAQRDTASLLAAAGDHHARLETMIVGTAGDPDTADQR
ncbi:MAG: GntR family transcriptional regulator [Corynebacteriales bacterium]|uniref:GntR family transcriptional regulator n=1 Tax=Williamsia herbipolensis TaxID=1603258 RepID=A0AAU4K6A7_9NOCA|nr:GntR family transcriptional regulator [Williamsia herbipolensis]MCX6471611.1 GntR family transcriptional regulator [Mycobacteriales bacterium]